MITVRYFAGAAEAAGIETEVMVARTADGLRQAMAGAHGPGLARVLERCSLLADGLRVDGQTPIPDGATVDVLPPFAGG